MVDIQSAAAEIRRGKK